MINYPEPGKSYRHYKGGIYKVLFLSKHTENEEILVNYQSLLFGSYYSKPIESWNELCADGEIRFKLIENQ